MKNNVKKRENEVEDGDNIEIIWNSLAMCVF